MLGLPCEIRPSVDGGGDGGFSVGDEGRRAGLATEDLRLAALCFAARYSFRWVS